MKDNLEFDIARVEKQSDIELPVYASLIEAGFPSPADDYLETKLDLNDLLIKRPAATFLVRVRGNSMRDSGILDGSILVVDSSIDPRSGMIVLAIVDNEFTVKRLIKLKDHWVLRPDNSDYENIVVTSETEIRGVVTSCIQKFTTGL